MASTEEPILSRLDRLDTMLRQLEEIRGCNMRSSSSAKSSYASTPSSGPLASDGGLISSADLSPESLEKHCRPINVVMIETEVKGSLIERLAHVENRILEMEEEIEAEKKRVKEEESRNPNPKKKTKGLKQLVKSCVGGKRKTKDSKAEG